MKGLLCTTILYILTLTGAAINYMLRVNISMAIVDMTKPSTQDHANKFNWSMIEKNELLAIYLWGYIVSVPFGGQLADRYGGRIIMGSGMFVSSLLTLFFPLLCRVHLNVAIASRFFIGITLGTYYPSILPLGVKWVPPLDRSKFASNVAASGFGVAVTLPLCGFLIHFFGWESVFYVTGSIGLVWCLLWFSFVYDSPKKHPRMSQDEKDYIEKKIKEGEDDTTKPKTLPWKKIYTSIPVWAIFFAQIGNGFYHFTYTMQLPTYMNDVLHFDIKNNGILSCIPYIGYYITSVLGAHIADKLLQSKKFSTFTVRRIMLVISFYIPTILLLAAAFVNMPYIATVILLILTHLFKGPGISCYVSNSMDIAPNYSGTIFGSSLVFGSLSGWIGNKIVGILTKEVSDFESWKFVFLIIALVSSTGGTIFFIFGSGEVQEWNQQKMIQKHEEPEKKPLNVELE